MAESKAKIRVGITIDCDFNNQKVPVNFYIGDPHPETHPIHHQSSWINSKGGKVPKYITDHLSEIQKISERNKIPFKDAFVYIEEEIKLANEAKKQFRDNPNNIHDTSIKTNKISNTR